MSTSCLLLSSASKKSLLGIHFIPTTILSGKVTIALLRTETFVNVKIELDKNGNLEIGQFCTKNYWHLQH